MAASLPALSSNGGTWPLPRPADTLRPGNDNEPERADEALLRAALRIFEHHGLDATRFAHEQAEQAFFSGQRPAFRWWLAVTRTLDRKLVLREA
jgi:hypothetical protein